MKKLLVIVLALAGGAILMQALDHKADFVVPLTAPGMRSGSGVKTYEFTELFAQNREFSKLAKEGYYTVVEGYINTCTICKKLEADFQPLLDKRKDILFRRVHFPEGGVNQSFSGDSQEAYNQQIDDYFRRLGRYNFNHVVKTGTEYGMKTCGTPHIEIYGPDGKLLATDKCGTKNIKAGLAFLRSWIKAEA